MKIYSTREIVFSYIRRYFPNDKRWDSEKWVKLSEVQTSLEIAKKHPNN